MAEKAPARNQQAAHETTTEGLEELLALSREGMEGLAQSGQVWLDGTAELGRVWLAFWSEQLTGGVDTMQVLTSCHDWREAVDRQNDFIRVSLERACAQASRSTELVAGMITGSLKPLQENAHRAVERFPRPAA